MLEKKLHLHTHRHMIDRLQRESLSGHRGMVLWFTGLSGSGKSTIANLVEKKLHNKKIRTYLLDGDNIRSGLNSDLDFSKSGRSENIRRIAEVSKLFADAGIIVLTAFISPFIEDRNKSRQIIGEEDFFEIYIEASLSTCEKRDAKGLYKKARKGVIKDFTGIQSPYEAPENPEFKLNTEIETAEECALRLVQFLEEKLTRDLEK
ncbi:MAG: adenylyl-sulfate kinase [Saprospirales bacterium]|nr:MAG: adenylyl-sulfate kinase [Saprospirales bacterium]